MPVLCTDADAHDKWLRSCAVDLLQRDELLHAQLFLRAGRGGWAVRPRARRPARAAEVAPLTWPLLYIALDAPVTHVVPRVRGRRVGTRSGSGLVPREVGCRRGARLLLVLEALPLAPAEEADAAEVAPTAGAVPRDYPRSRVFGSLSAINR